MKVYRRSIYDFTCHLFPLQFSLFHSKDIFFFSKFKLHQIKYLFITV